LTAPDGQESAKVPRANLPCKRHDEQAGHADERVERDEYSSFPEFVACICHLNSQLDGREQEGKEGSTNSVSKERGKDIRRSGKQEGKLDAVPSSGQDDLRKST
jgi:hypothetical protein